MNRVSRITAAALACGLLLAPATATAQAAPSTVPAAAAQDVDFNTGSAGADAVINGLITVIFGPNDPTKCKFPYCF